MGWPYWGQRQLGDPGKHANKPRFCEKAGNFFICWETIRFSKTTLFHGDNYYEPCIRNVSNIYLVMKNYSKKYCIKYNVVVDKENLRVCNVEAIVYQNQDIFYHVQSDRNRERILKSEKFQWSLQLLDFQIRYKLGQFEDKHYDIRECDKISC